MLALVYSFITSSWFERFFKGDISQVDMCADHVRVKPSPDHWWWRRVDPILAVAAAWAFQPAAAESVSRRHYFAH